MWVPCSEPLAAGPFRCRPMDKPRGAAVLSSWGFCSTSESDAGHLPLDKKRPSPGTPGLCAAAKPHPQEAREPGNGSSIDHPLSTPELVREALEAPRYTHAYNYACPAQMDAGGAQPVGASGIRPRGRRTGEKARGRAAARREARGAPGRPGAKPANSECAPIPGGRCQCQCQCYFLRGRARGRRSAAPRRGPPVGHGRRRSRTRGGIWPGGCLAGGRRGRGGGSRVDSVRGSGPGGEACEGWNGHRCLIACVGELTTRPARARLRRVATAVGARPSRSGSR